MLKYNMSVEVILWVAGERLLVKHVSDGMLPSPVTDPPVVHFDVLVLMNPCLHYLWAAIPYLKAIHFK
jgi:hypothetical protein